MSISSEQNTDSTESDGEYDSKHDPDQDMCMEDDVDAPDGVDLDGDVDMEKDGDDEEEEDEDEDDKAEEQEKQEEEDEDDDEDDGNEPRTISQGRMVNTSADNVDTMLDYQPIVLPEQGEEMREHTPRPQPPVLAPLPPTPESRPRPRMPESNPLSRLEDLGLVTPQKPRPAVPSPRKAEAAGYTLDVDVDQQLLSKSAGGDSLPDIPLPDVPLPEVRWDGSVAEEWSSPRVAKEVMVVAFGLGSGCCLVSFLCSNVFISGIDYYTCREVFGSLSI